MITARLPKVVRAPEVDVTEQARKLLTQQLEKLISVAVKDNDASLTKKKCREMLALLFGEQRVEEQKEHISAEVSRLVPEYRQMEEEALVALVEGLRGVTKEEIEALDEDPDIDHHEASEPGSKDKDLKKLKSKKVKDAKKAQKPKISAGKIFSNRIVIVNIATQFLLHF